MVYNKKDIKRAASGGCRADAEDRISGRFFFPLQMYGRNRK